MYITGWLVCRMLPAVYYDCWQVSSADGGHDIGRIYKQWSGFVREMATDADNFGVSCESARIFAVAFDAFSCSRSLQR